MPTKARTRATWGPSAVLLLACSSACNSAPAASPRSGERCDRLQLLPAGNEVLVLGDSTFASNRSSCGDVGDYLSLLLGARVVDRAAAGLRLSNAKGPDITARYRQAAWSWVVIAGGGNDLASCACSSPESCQCSCQGSVSELISADTESGSMVELVQAARADGAHVALLGYYDPAPSSPLHDIGCDDEHEDLRTRYAQLAVRLPGVYFADGRDALSPGATPGAYQADGTHPSPDGAERLARLLYDAMSRRGGSGE
jgi:lysophospholipase L1-like esterase